MSSRHLNRTLPGIPGLAVLAMFGALAQATPPAAAPAPQVLWYEKPAAKWVEALPVGNGRLGAMVFGGVQQERLQLNEGRYRDAAHLISAKVMAKPLAEIATLGLPIHITELDVHSAQGGQRGFGADIASNAATTQGGLVSDADRKQAEAYAGIFRAFLKHDQHVEMVTFWGPNDANSWRANGKPLLFDGDSQPKPASQAVIAEVKPAAAAR